MDLKNIDLQIDELVLRGFSPLDGNAIRDSIETELKHLIATRGLDAAGISLDSVNGGRFKVTRGAHPQATGAQIARSIFGSLKGGTR